MPDVVADGSQHGGEELEVGELRGDGAAGQHGGQALRHVRRVRAVVVRVGHRIRRLHVLPRQRRDLGWQPEVWVMPGTVHDALAGRRPARRAAIAEAGSF